MGRLVFGCLVGGGVWLVEGAHIEHNLKKYYKNEKLLPCNTSSKKMQKKRRSYFFFATEVLSEALYEEGKRIYNAKFMCAL